MSTLTGTAFDRAAAVAERCAKARQHGTSWKACCPAHDDTKPSLSITPTGDRVLIKCFAACTAEAIVTALGLTLRDLFAEGPTAHRHPRRRLAESANLSNRSAKQPCPQPVDSSRSSRDISEISGISRGSTFFSAERRWQEARPLRATDPVWGYLRARDVAPQAAPPALRYHPRLPYRHEGGTWTHHPAMLASVSTCAGVQVALHRTYLDLHGHKAPVPSPKKITAPATPGALRGASIPLFAATTLLALTEGIETALAVHRLSGWPTWSCVSATGLEQVEVPDTITTLYICADHDPTGLCAAYALARRQASHRTVKVLVPPCPGEDWLDVLQREGV